MTKAVQMRESVSSVALFQRRTEGKVLWLLQWNAKWRIYSLVAGHLENGESHRECILREVCEELGLDQDIEFSVSLEARARMEFEDWSESANEQTAYTMELFDADLLTGSAYRKVSENPMNRWVTEDEIGRGQCDDGEPISPTVIRLLNEVGCRPEALD